MRARRLVTAAVAACLVLPIAVEAQAQPGQAQGDQPHPDRRGHPGGQPGGQGARPAGQPPVARPGGVQGAPGRHVGAGGYGPVPGAPGIQVPPGQSQRGQGHRQGVPGAPGIQVPPGQIQRGQGHREGVPGTGPGGFPAIQTHPGSPPVGQAPARIAPTMRRPSYVPQLGGWNPGLRGPARDQAGRQWRQNHRGWDSHAPWRRGDNWWRGNSAFQLFLGPRLGYFFVPELGYVGIPPEYEHRRWLQGDHLPSWFWRYVVHDYWNYGLPEPPPGCIWVWVGNDIALIDTSDGYILDIAHDVW